MKKYYHYHLKQISCTESNAYQTILKEECKCSYLYPADNAQYVKLNDFLCHILFLFFNNFFNLGSINFRDYHDNIFYLLYCHVFNRALYTKIEFIFANTFL